MKPKREDFMVAVVVMVRFGTVAGREQEKNAPTFLSSHTPVSCWWLSLAECNLKLTGRADLP